MGIYVSVCRCSLGLTNVFEFDCTLTPLSDFHAISIWSPIKPYTFPLPSIDEFVIGRPETDDSNIAKILLSK